MSENFQKIMHQITTITVFKATPITNIRQPGKAIHEATSRKRTHVSEEKPTTHSLFKILFHIELLVRNQQEDQQHQRS